MKNGPPINDIIIPAGSSNGAKMVLPIRSHRVTNIAPRSAQHGSRSLASFPNILRAICGTIKPTKLKSPA